LWLATGTGLWSLDPATGQTRQYSHDPNEPLSLSSSEVKSSGEDREGRFWVASSEGLDEFDRNTGKVSLHISLREPLPEFSFYEDRFGVFWIYPSGSGLAAFDRKTNTVTRYSIVDQEQPSNFLTSVMAVLEDGNGTLWLGTRGAGLLKFDREHQGFIRSRNKPDDPQSLPENYILSLCEDQEGGIWAGLGTQGLAHFDPKGPPFARLDPAGSTRLVNAVFEDDAGIVWLATREALHSIDRKSPSPAYRTSPPGAVLAIRQDASGDLWLGTYNQGLHRFDRRTGHYKTYQHNSADPYSLSSGVVTRLLIDHSGTLWAATFDGLNRFDPATERFTTYTSDPQSKKLYYLELVEGPKGDLWLGTFYSGLQRFEPGTGKFTTYEHDLNQPGTLSDNRVNSIHFDRSDTMWVGTQNGLNRFDPNTNTFNVYTQNDGLPGNVVSCILEDELGSLWMSTNNGVAKFNPQTRSFTNYSTADGLPDLDLSGWGNCFKSSSGEMFFGGYAGGRRFPPGEGGRHDIHSTDRSH
jgi:ligand-binding sensor domain-containing protein